MSEITQMRSTGESRMAQDNQQNAGGQRRIDDNGKPYYDPAPLSEYPRMMYKATDHEQTQDWADAIGDLKDKPMVINKFGGLLCETIIAHSADEAEVLAANGWDVTPQAAHGQTDGLVKAVSAKDERIAELEAMLAAAQAPNEQAPEPSQPTPERRAPGRPRLTPAE